MRILSSISTRIFWTVAVLAFILTPWTGVTAQEKEQAAAENHPMVVMETSKGAIKLELWADRAPITVENFLRYAREGHYEGTIFHRVMDDFMIQGGGFTPDLQQKPTHDPIQNEAAEDLPNVRGTIAMARTSVIDSATAQFFINVTDNDFLNHRGTSSEEFGYAVFGQVVEGMDVVDRIKEVPTTSVGPHRNVPVEPVVIQKVEILE